MHREPLFEPPLGCNTGSVLTIIRIRVQMGAMIICVCKAVSDRHIRAAVNCGATSMRDLSRQLGIGTCCGKCVPEARAALSASLELPNQPDALVAA